VIQCLPLDRLLVVREDYFQVSRGQSNVYCLDGDFRLLWKVELPNTSDAYVGVEVTETGLKCSSGEGNACIIIPARVRFGIRHSSNEGLLVKGAPQHAAATGALVRLCGVGSRAIRGCTSYVQLTQVGNHKNRDSPLL
jgi:hypothetical protein